MLPHMLATDLRYIAEVQVERLRALASIGRPALSGLLTEAVTPDNVRQALLKERPLLFRHRLTELPGTDPHDLRQECVSVGRLDGSAEDLAFRRLYPALDLGIYCANHAMGKPSRALNLALEQHVGELSTLGIDAWMEADWVGITDRFRYGIAALVGDDLRRGDVVWFANFSDSLCAVLASLRGKLLTTAGHFTSAHYIHRSWAVRTGSTTTVVPFDEHETVDAERLVGALDGDVSVVSLSHAFYRNGFLHDLELIAEGMAAKCPDAALILDGYQTLGTVPVDVSTLPTKTAILGGGIKQLRAGTGAGFAWFSNALLELLDPDRFGWWAHVDPIAFDHGPFQSAAGAAKFRTGTPAMAPMVALNCELDVLASSTGGDLQAAVTRTRLRTSRQVAAVVDAARDAGLVVAGGDRSRRAAFLGIHVSEGPRLVEALKADGVTVDFRPSEAGNAHGLIRISTSSASFVYEPLYALERLLAHIS